MNYNQPGVSYMKGHAGIVITGADEQTNVSVFTVGRKTAANQGLFKDTVSDDGIADLAFIAIQSANGKFGGLRTRVGRDPAGRAGGTGGHREEARRAQRSRPTSGDFSTLER